MTGLKQIWLDAVTDNVLVWADVENRKSQKKKKSHEFITIITAGVQVIKKSHARINHYCCCAVTAT
jgi:hypothetical protein